MTRPIGAWPQQGSVHKSGDRFVGHPTPRVRDVWLSGRAPVSILLRSSVTPLIANVRIGDELTVDRDGKHWWASSEAGPVGRLTWREEDPTRVTWFDYNVFYPTVGLLRVERLLISNGGAVVNCNGSVLPL